jgi:ATP-dependent helicase/nuclease subunit A
MSQPFAHQLIRASAGSGKTHQLTNRYLALLAAGAPPETMVAATFTRKAAGEILERCLQRLATAAADRDKARVLAEQTGAATLTQDCVRHLRRLLQALHRVRIGTLDSFYLALAGTFSLELGLPAGWSICEDVDDADLRSEALERLLEQAPDDIGRLLPLLSKGEVQRSIHSELLEIIGIHYDIFRGSEQAAWERLDVPPPVGAAQLTAALQQLRSFDFSDSHDKRVVAARDLDLAKFEAEDWHGFIDSGLAGKLVAGETTYHGKAIPVEAQALYENLLQHVRAQILHRLSCQTRATWELLARFHAELWALKRSVGGLRFDEVTHALVDALHGQSLGMEELAFRLDGAVEHLLLDEFQDTALMQWRVLEPMAQRITQSAGEAQRSFFCVGDLKQAIYSWRGGLPAIFATLPETLGQLQPNMLVESRRSAQPLIDVVNRVFGGLDQFQAGDKPQEGLIAWSHGYEAHTTVHKEMPGYVCLHTGPAQGEDESLSDQRGRHCKYVAMQIAQLARQAPGASVGVLCRTNSTVARMIYELRESGVDASEEGGCPLTDSPAVELILSLFTLADHGGHSVAEFHLRNSPLEEHVRAFTDGDSLARHLRRELLTRGCGPFVQDWAGRLVPSCAARDLSRLQQIVEMAYTFQARSTLRAAAFVAWVKSQRVPDPTDAPVRVMTIHAAKGLEFDVVVLPELDNTLTSQPARFVVDRDPRTLDVNFVCRYADENVQKLLGPEERAAFDRARQHQVEESLCMLYVAMTRAKHALYLFIPGPRDGRSGRKDAWYNLLLQTLVPGQAAGDCASLLECGNRAWFEHIPPAAAPAPERTPQPIVFAATTTARRRGLEHVAPSRREGQAQVALDHLFHPSAGTGMAAGTIYHAWFAMIGWLEDGVPSKEALLDAAQRELIKLSVKERPKVDDLLATFQTWLQDPQIAAVLQRSAYASPLQPGYPITLAPLWRPIIAPQQVERERRFLIQDESKFWNGSFDRIVWLGDRDRLVAADVIDFKTDDIAPGDDQGLAARTAHYRPQLEAYRKAIARLGGLPLESIAARLAFTCAGSVVDV